MTKPLVTVGIAGGSGSGKTTLARRLFQELGKDNVNYILHDSYYKDISHKTIEERAKTNFDHPDSLDTELLIQHVQELKQGRTVQVPTYDFVTHSRQQKTIEVKPAKVILLEGILLFSNPQLLEELDIRVYVDADADIRFIRRLQRDIAERGRAVDDIVHQYHETVRPMHNIHVEPSKLEADLIVNSTGHSMQVAMEMIVNHVKVKAGIRLVVQDGEDDEAKRVLKHGASYDPVSDSFREVQS